MNTKIPLEFDLEQVARQIAEETGLRVNQVLAAAQLFDDGNTIPFIARYRKEATQALDEVALRDIEQRLSRARELLDRKNTILKSIQQQERLTDDLRQQIVDCPDKQTLENIYLPFKPKRRTRATVARERGLQPLAEMLLKQEPLGRSRRQILAEFIDPEREVPDETTALAGACDIVAETWSEQLETRAWMLEQAREYGHVYSTVKRGKKEEAEKFEPFFDHHESIKRIPSHRFLAMKRGEAEKLLRVGLQLNEEIVLRKLTRQLVGNPRFEFHRELLDVVQDSYQRLLLPATESSVLQELKERADAEAIDVFAQNLTELLLAPPAGDQVTMGIDPGYRTGCKVAVVDGTGKFLEHATVFATPPKNDEVGAKEKLMQLIHAHHVQLIAIGNGTASRETDRFVTKLIKEESLEITKVVVNESGASIYSASELAVKEYPKLDVTVRGAISIAHRLQDPLAELVKIDPKSIGVGQYQHDVNQPQLRKRLDQVVETCVNGVGVDVNLASGPLLSHVAGIGPKLAENIVAFRDEHGAFTTRKQLAKVPKLGSKAFQQSAGFLRIRGGDEPLDNSAVHPESYYIVAKMAKSLKTSPGTLVGDSGLASRLDPKEFVDDQFGLPTIKDILDELGKPGRDPRKKFRVANFADGVEEMADLKIGMVLEGTVTNVTKFGAFVDVGVHQDGLVHISQLSNQYVNDPSEVVSVGDVIRVKVLEVDQDRKRISLSAKQA